MSAPDYMENAHAVMAEALTGDEMPEAMNLVARLVQANYNDYANTTSMLLERFQQQLSDRDAELGAIRTRINELFAGPYMPTQNAIEMAVFYPDKDLIEQCRERRAES